MSKLADEYFKLYANALSDKKLFEVLLKGMRDIQGVMQNTFGTYEDEEGGYNAHVQKQSENMFIIEELKRRYLPYINIAKEILLKEKEEQDEK